MDLSTQVYNKLSSQRVGLEIPMERSEVEALRRLSEEMDDEQSERFEILMNEVIRRRRERADESTQRIRSGEASDSEPRRWRGAERSDADRRDGDRRNNEDAGTASTGETWRRAGEFEDVGDGVQVRRSAVGQVSADGGNSKRPDHESRARERTVGFRESRSRNQSVYETASESTSPSPLRGKRRRTSKERRRIDSGNRLGRGIRLNQRRRGDSSSPEVDPSQDDKDYARKRSSPNFGGKQSNIVFNASQQIGRFDGRNEPLENFLAKFEGCADHLNWSDSEKQFHLRLCLTGPAAQILWDSSKTDTADKIIELLRNRYGSLGQAERWRTELKIRKRRPNESLQELYSDVLRLFSLAYPKCDNDVFATFLRDAFLDSLNNQQLYVRIVEKEPSNIDEALQCAMRFEAYDKSTCVVDVSKSETDFAQIKPKYVRATGVDNVQPIRTKCPEAEKEDRITKLLDSFAEMSMSMKHCVETIQNQERAINYQDQEIKRLSQRVSEADGSRQAEASRVQASAESGRNKFDVSRNSSKFTNYICRECGQMGHIARYCPNRNRVDTDSTDVKQSMVRQTKSSEDCVYVPAVIQDSKRKILILCDTGCQANVVGRFLVPDVELKPGDTKMTAANGSPIKVLGYAQIKVLIGGMQVNVDAAVSDEIDDFIVGVQFLTQNNCIWNFSRKTIRFRGKEIKLVSQPLNGLVRRVLVADDVTIASQSLVECAVRIPHKSLMRSGDSWLIDLDHLPSEVAAGRVIVSDDVARTVVRLINMGGESVTIKRGGCVGRGYPAEVADSSPRRAGNDGKAVGPDAEGSGFDDGRGSDVGRVTETDDYSHVQPLIDGLPTDLSVPERAKAVELIRGYAHVFSKNEYDIGRTDLISHEINTGDAQPIRQTLRRHPQTHLPIIDEFVDDLLEKDLIEPCRSPWASNVVLARRKNTYENKILDKSCFRFCVDLRACNSVIIPDGFHPPRVETCLESLGGAKYFCVLDSMSAYHMIPLANEESKNKTAFITRRGLYRYKYLPFGEKNACATYSRLMCLVLAGLPYDVALSFLDDLIVMAPTFDEACDRLRLVFDRIVSAGIKFKVSKSKILQRSVTFLSFRISEDGILPDEDKVKDIVRWPKPTNLTETRAFIGVCAYYRKFIKDFAGIAKPLYELTKKGVRFVWGPAQNQAFEELKQRLVTAPILASPLSEGDWKVESDASGHSVAAILYQKQNDNWHVIAYASRVLNNAETSYCSSRTELLAVVFALKQFRHFLLGRKFTIVVDNSSLQYLMRSEMLLNMEARYLAFISEFDFVIERVPGRSHSAADGLSRKPCVRDDAATMCDRCKPRVRAVKSRRRGGTVINGVVGSETCPPATTSCTGERREVAAEEDSLAAASASTRNKPRRTNQPPSRDYECPLTDDILRIEQQSDSSIRSIVELLRPDVNCEWSDVNNSNAETRILFSQRQSLFVQNGILYRKFVNTDGVTLYNQVVVPYSLRVKYLECVHGAKLSGHLGVTKSRYRLQRFAYWPGWLSDLKLFVKCCVQCNGVRKCAYDRHAPLRYANTDGVFVKVHIDLTGPHVKSRKGFIYILTATCSFSKYLITVPLRNKSCYTVANELVRRIYLVFGPCEICVHDGGLEFCNELSIAINSLLEITSSKVTCYRPMGNGQAERVHAVLNKLMATVVDRDQRNWDECLPYITFAYNTSQHITTSFSPFFLMFNREAKIGVDLVSDLDSNTFEGPVAEYVSLIRQRMHAAYAMVNDNMQTSFERAKQRYDSRVKVCQFDVGQRVWYFCPRRRRGVSYKWSMSTSGPYEIVKKINDVNYVIRLSPRHRSFVVNIDRLRVYDEKHSTASGQCTVNSDRIDEFDGGEERPLSLVSTRPKRSIKMPSRLRD